MSDKRTDRDLLRAYLRTGSETAFRELVTRHARMVQATATRVTGSQAGADEITQDVFIVLAKKAHWLVSHESLAGWLHQAAVLEARHWSRGEHRRLHRDHHAYEMASVMHDKPSLSTEQLALLDEALLGLTDDDRQLIILRHCEGNSYPEIALQLGLREDAVRKRCDKAMEQVTAFFRKRGLAVGGTAALSAGLNSTAVAISPSFCGTVTQAALAAAPIASLGTLPFLVGKFLAMTKAQLVAITLVVAALPVAYGVGLIQTTGREHRYELVQLANLESDYAAANVELRNANSRLAQAQRRRATASATTARPAQSTDNRSITWTDGSPYTRISKTAIGKMKPLGLDASWQPTSFLRQLLALNESEDQKVKATLTAFTDEIRQQNEAHLKRIPAEPSFRNDPTEESVAFVMDEREGEAQDAARHLESNILELLGEERGRIALNHFALPQLPAGTTDYEKYRFTDTVNNIMSPATIASQGVRWEFTFRRYRLPNDKTAAVVESVLTSRGGILMHQFWDAFDHAAVPESLRTFWQQWKAGDPVANP